MQTFKLFVSSPGDVMVERRRVENVVSSLNGEFAGVARLETIRWETEFYQAYSTFQAQIPRSTDCDLVVGILKWRLGTELPPDFAEKLPNGQPFPSGTAYEILTAIEKRQKGVQLPDIYVFRFMASSPSLTVEDPNRVRIEHDWQVLKGFFQAWFVTSGGQFKAAFNPYSSEDDFEAQLERLLRKWIADKVAGGRVVRWPIEVKGSPFLGLAAFGAKHAPVFFGRSHDTTRALDLWREAGSRGTPYLLVMGASGSGKSSLARAGLVPRLTTPGVIKEVDVWRIAVMRPSDSPMGSFAALAAALMQDETGLPKEEEGRGAALPEIGHGDSRTPSELATVLRHADTAAVKPIVNALSSIAESEHDRESYRRDVRCDLVLLIDQLEELFAASVSETERTCFIDLIAALVGTGRIWVAATLRADFYARMLDQPVLKKLKELGATYDLASPGPVELAEIVRSPAEAAGLVYETDGATGERLDARLLRDADRPDMLPLVQLALSRVYEGRETVGGEVLLPLKIYESLGGLKGIVNEAGETALASLSDAEKARLPRLLRQLAVQAQDHEGTGKGVLTIRAVPLAQAAPDYAARRLLDALVTARLLTTSGVDVDAQVRLTHQRVLEDWGRAREIAKNNADFFRIRAEVEEQQRRWENNGQRADLLISRGLTLLEAEKMDAGFGEELNAGTRTFIKTSGRRARTQQRLLQTAVVAFAALFVVAGIFAVIAERRGTAALRAQSKILSVIAEHTSAPDRKMNTPDAMFMSGDPTSGALLALQGLPYPGFGGNRPSTPDLEIALYDALLRIRETTLTGHAEQVNTALFSPDGQRLVTASADHTARLWQRAGSKWASIVLSGHFAAINSVAFSPNGNRLVTVSDDHTARLWDIGVSPPTSQLLQGHDAAVTYVAFSRDNRYFVTTSDDNTALLWDAQAAQPSSSVLRGHSDVVNFAVFSPDNRRLITTSWDHTARLWDLSVAQPTSIVLEGHTGRVSSAAFSPDGGRLVTTSNDGTARLWTMSATKPVSMVLELHSFPVNSATFSADGSHIATVSDDHAVHLWNIAAAQPTLVILRGHSDAVNHVVFSPDGKHVATAANDRTIRLWDMNGRQIVLEGHAGPITSIAFSPNGQHLVTASRDRTARIWDVIGAMRTSEVLRAHDGAVNFVTFSPDGLFLVTASDDNTVRLWGTKDTSQPSIVLQGHVGSVNSATFSPDGNMLATASWDRTVRIWDLRQLQTLPVVFRGHSGSVNSVAFSPDGKMLATASDDHTVRLWDMNNTSEAARLLQGHEGPVSSVAFSPDGRSLATASRDQTVRLWDLTAAQPTWIELRGHSGAVNSAVFSPDGRVLVTSSHDQTARLWDLRKSEPNPIILRGHTDSVNAAAFSPDGRHLITVSSDHNARLWDYSGAEPVSFVLEGHSRPVTSVAFAPDGRHFATGSWDNTARIWVHYPALSELIAAVYERSQRCLTSAQRTASGLSQAPGASDDPYRVPPLVVGADGIPRCE